MQKTLTTLLAALLLAVQALAQGPDKAALEAAFMERLAVYEPGDWKPQPDSLQRIGPKLYVMDKGFYETEAVRSQAYFTRKWNRYIPVNDASLPVESITTLLSGFTGDTRYNVSLLQRRYNYGTVQVELPLNKLLAFCLEDGAFKPYVGIESQEGDTIKASLFLVSEKLGYCHTFNFSIPKALLGQNTGTLQAEAYTFTPIHNLAR